MISIISLLVVLTLSILVTRIATVALTHTGLSRESAKFQARSAFTGVGFTTNESEKVVNHPIRRRILLLLMLLGNAGVVTAVSSLILSFADLNESRALLWRVVLLVSGLVILWSFAASKYVDRHLSNLVSKALKRYTNLKVQDFAKLLHLAGDYQITELQVQAGDWLAGRSLGELGLRQEGIMVLGITRENGGFIGTPDGSTAIKADDVLILYGRAEGICDLDERQHGYSGNMAHQKKVVDQKKMDRKEKEADDP
jgi:K+/H+ antiporter YhaU regulatory subunit KhtT